MRRSLQRFGAFTLVEVTLAIGIAAFSLLAIFGLLPLGINTNQQALEQTGANDLLSAVGSDLRSTPVAFAKGQSRQSQQFLVPIPLNPVLPASLPSTVYRYVTADGISSTSLTSDSHYLLTVNFVPNGNAPRAPTLAKLAVSWPATAGTGNRIGFVEQLLVLDRN